jgi:2,4-dienoyl-CoA reductase-like NADH-dependent reductase (Old Yellow Enzyme family)
MAPMPSGAAGDDGFADEALIGYYARRAKGGVGLILSEAMWVTPPGSSDPGPHLGIYADAFIPQLRRLVTASRAHGARVLLTLEAPAPAAIAPAAALHELGEAFVAAIARAHRAGADGVLLSAADGGALHCLLSPLHNQREDRYGGAAGRSRLVIEIVEAARAWLGSRLIIGARLLADEFVPGGFSTQDARILARRLTAAGVRLLDVTAPPNVSNIARFPGWAIPLASSIRRVLDVPVIGSGELDDPLLADSIVRDGLVDLVMLDEALRRDPDWPQRAHEALAEL